MVNYMKHKMCNKHRKYEKQIKSIIHTLIYQTKPNSICKSCHIPLF